MNSVAVLGLGKVGTLVGVLLDKQFSVKGYDLHKPHYEIDIPFPYEIVDISNTDNVHSILDDADAVVSALPYYLNKSIAEIACQKGVHYFDLTEDVKTTQHIQHLKESASAVLAPQCGLAPGFIGIIGGDKRI
jgi:saccharopine dehydrogenase-like NADP-dependent oxidoreductase